MRLEHNTNISLPSVVNAVIWNSPLLQDISTYLPVKENETN